YVLGCSALSSERGILASWFGTAPSSGPVRCDLRSLSIRGTTTLRPDGAPTLIQVTPLDLSPPFDEVAELRRAIRLGTDRDGHFSLYGLPEGRYHLKNLSSGSTAIASVTEAVDSVEF
ncbi:MAG: hypothetical protein MK291_11175, partial [Planctomycetes bacterium]|nr:hypothetical protein [Planctomycetota bacterium]